MDRSPIRILIVEADADEAALVDTYLTADAGRAESFALTHAPRLSSACHLLGRQDFDVVLLDLVLPRSVGLEGFRKLRELRPALPIILLTGMHDEPLAVQAMSLGAHDYFIKGSQDCILLKRAVRYALDRKRLTDAITELLASDAASQTEDSSRRRLPERAPWRVRPSIVQPDASAQEPAAADGRSPFMSRITHELRNTLSTLTTAAYCLKDGVAGALTPRQSGLVDMISRNVERQTRILETMIDTPRSSSGERLIQFRPLDAGQIIARIVADRGHANGGARLRADVKGGLPPTTGDARLIAQALELLVDNALRFARQNVVVEAVKSESGQVVLSVVDDGAGIAADRLERLRLEFSRAPSAREDGEPRENVYEESGVGLSICREIAAGHRGTLWVDSEPGRETRFSFTLPSRDVAARLFTRDSAAIAASAGRPVARVLNRSDGHRTVTND